MHKDIILELQRRAKEDKAASDMFHVLATRKRARSVLTVQAFRRRLKKEGFEYTRAQVSDFFKFLGSVGVGELDSAYKGRVRGLKRIRVTLESIGLAACGDTTRLASSPERTRYSPIAPLPAKRTLPPAPPQGATARDPKSKDGHISVSTFINGKTVTVHIPEELGPKDVADLIELFRGSQSA